MPHPHAAADFRIPHAAGRTTAASATTVMTSISTITGTGTTGPGMRTRARS